MYTLLYTVGTFWPWSYLPWMDGGNCGERLRALDLDM